MIGNRFQRKVLYEVLILNSWHKFKAVLKQMPFKHAIKFLLRRQEIDPPP